MIQPHALHKQSCWQHILLHGRLFSRKQSDRMTDPSVVPNQSSCRLHSAVYIMNLFLIIMGACCIQALLSCWTSDIALLLFVFRSLGVCNHVMHCNSVCLSIVYMWVLNVSLTRLVISDKRHESSPFYINQACRIHHWICVWVVNVYMFVRTYSALIYPLPPAVCKWGSVPATGRWCLACNTL